MARALILKLMLISAFVVPQPLNAADLVGIYGQWGAFRQAGGAKCYAIRLPEQDGGQNAYLSVVIKENEAPKFYARLARSRSLTSDASASVGGRRFVLGGNGRDLFARDSRMDRAIIAAIRSARALSIEAVGSDGRAIVDAYDLQGAATAIDAARLACRGDG